MSDATQILQRIEQGDPKAAEDLLPLVYVSSIAIDREELSRVADGVLSELKVRPFLQVGKGMALSRLGRFEEAVSVLPESTANFSNPKDELLALIFRAMTHFHLSDDYTCRKLLAQAHEAIAKQLPSPDGPQLPYQDRPVAWCIVQTALREAEALIKLETGHTAKPVPSR